MLLQSSPMKSSKEHVEAAKLLSLSAIFLRGEVDVLIKLKQLFFESLKPCFLNSYGFSESVYVIKILTSAYVFPSYPGRYASKNCGIIRFHYVL